MRALAFANRNLKEIIRDPLSLIFNLAFPVVLLLIFQLITSGMPEEALEQVYQFKIERLAPNIAMFSFSFITLFAGMLISKDRTTSFLARLKTSPLKSSEFLLGYTLPMIPIAFVQIVLCYGVSCIFGLEITGNLMLTFIGLIPIALLFIALGLLFGTICNDKAIGGISSIVINVAAIFGGIFMPLDTLGKTVKTIAYIFPFANSSRMVNCIMSGDYTDFWKSFAIVMAYLVVTVVLSIIIFKKKINSDKI